MNSFRSRRFALVGSLLSMSALAGAAHAAVGVDFGLSGISPNPGFWDSSSNIVIGSGTNSRVSVTGPDSITVTSLTLGPTANFQGDLRLLGAPGAGVTFNVTGSTTVGQNGVGTIFVNGGADLTTVGTNMGLNTGSNSLVTVTGAGSTWTGGLLQLGVSGAASLQINSGAQVTASSVLAAINTGSSVFLDVDGTNSSFTSGNFTAYQQPFSMSATGGGKIAINGNFLLQGNNLPNNANRIVFVNGNNSEFKVTGTTTFGSVGNATLSVDAGGKLDLQEVLFGSAGSNSAVGNLSVSGGTASFLTADLRRGTFTQTGGLVGSSFLNIATENQENYTANISGGITQAFDIKLSGAGGVAKVNLTGGLLKAFGTLYVYGNFAGNTDVLDANGGDVEAVTLRIGGSASNAIMRVRGSNSNLLVSSQLVVGDVSGSNSQLQIAANATATIENAKIGDEVAGELDLLNAASANIKILTVGGPGKGVVKVRSSAELFGSNLTVGNSDDTIDELTIESNAEATYTNVVFNSDSKVTLLNGTLAYGQAFVNTDNFKFFAGTLQWNGNNAYVAGSPEEIMLNGNGTIKIGQTFYMNGLASFTTPLEINGGTLRVGQLGTGFFEFTKGKLHVDSSIVIDDGEFFGNELVLRQETLYQADGDLFNYGTVSGNGRVIANLVNGSTGKIKVNLGQTIDFDRSEHFNGGTFELAGGTLRVRNYLLSSTNGLIKGYGTLDLSDDQNPGKLDLYGQMQLTGNATIIGNVETFAGSKIAISGAASNVFQGNLKNNGQINVASGANLVILGEYSGAGTTTGSGKIFFEGGVNPGNSPATFFFNGDTQIGPGALIIEIGGLTPGSEHDTFDITGTLTIQDAPLNVVAYDLGSGLFKPKAGDSFDILDFASVVGAFSSVNLFALDAGLAWDISALYTTGTISVFADGSTNPIPEPTSLSLLALGAAALLHRRRR